jgi:hypothetical protein
MNDAEAKRHLQDVLGSFRAGAVLHMLAEVVRESETARLGGLDEAAQERVREAEAALWVFGYGLMAALPG